MNGFGVRKACVVRVIILQVEYRTFNSMTEEIDPQ